MAGVVLTTDICEGQTDLYMHDPVFGINGTEWIQEQRLMFGYEQLTKIVVVERLSF